MVSMVGNRQAQCWSNRWGLYILICWQQVKRKHSRCSLVYAFETSNPIPVTHLFQQGNAYFNKDSSPNPSQTFCQLGTKHTNKWTYKGYSDLNDLIVLPGSHRLIECKMHLFSQTSEIPIVLHSQHCLKSKVQCLFQDSRKSLNSNPL